MPLRRSERARRSRSTLCGPKKLAHALHEGGGRADGLAGMIDEGVLGETGLDRNGAHFIGRAS